MRPRLDAGLVNTLRPIARPVDLCAWRCDRFDDGSHPKTYYVQNWVWLGLALAGGAIPQLHGGWPVILESVIFSAHLLVPTMLAALLPRTIDVRHPRRLQEEQPWTPEARQWRDASTSPL